MHRFLRDYIKYIKLERHYSIHTIDAYQGDLLQFETFLQQYYHTDQVNWQLVTRRILRAYLGWLSTYDLQRISIARKLATVKSFFSFLTQQKQITVNPAQTLKTPKYSKKLPEFLSIESVEKLMELPAVNTFEGVRDRTILELFYASGIRRAELIDLKLNNLLLNEGLIRVYGKGGKERVLPLGIYALKQLQKYLIQRQSFVKPDVDHVFILKSGKVTYPMIIHRIISKYLAKISEIKKKSPHVLRHTYATHLMNQGADIRAVKDLLGHANLSTTQIYTQTSIDHLKKIYARAHPGGDEPTNKK
jgi:integrase/recombinase XerC